MSFVTRDGGEKKRNSFYREILRIKRCRKAKRKMDFSFESKGVEIVEIVNDMMIIFLFFFNS